MGIILEFKFSKRRRFGISKKYTNKLKFNKIKIILPPYTPYSDEYFKEFEDLSAELIQEMIK